MTVVLMKEIWNLFKNLYFLNLPKVTFIGHAGKYRISLTFPLNGADKGGVMWKLESIKRPFSSVLKYVFQLTSNRHELVLLGKHAQLTKIHFRAKRTKNTFLFRSLKFSTCKTISIGNFLPARQFIVTKKTPCGVFVYGAPGEIRTPDLLVRSQTLYPTGLRAHTILLSFARLEPNVI